MKGGEHLSDHEILEVVEDRADEDAQAHAAACGPCAARVKPLRAVLGRVRADDIPEPSPLFWDHLSARVAAAVAEERGAAGGAGWRFPWGWKSAVLAAAAACVVAAVALGTGPVGGPDGPVPTGTVSQPVASRADAEAVPADDGTFDLVAAIIARLDGEEAGEAGFDLPPGSVERAARQLSPDERDALVRVLEEELAGRPS